LIELILVLALLSIVAALVSPVLSGFIRGRGLDSEARRLVAVAHAGQSRAVSEGMPMLLWVNEKQNTYGLESETPPNGGDPKAQDFTGDENVRIAVPATAGTAPMTFHNLPAIRFLPDGTVDEDSPRTLQLTGTGGGELWLIQSRNRLGYEIRDTNQ